MTAWLRQVVPPQSSHAQDLPPDYNDLPPPTTQLPRQDRQLNRTGHQQNTTLSTPADTYDTHGLSQNRSDPLNVNYLADPRSAVIVEEEEEIAPPTYESLYADNKSENDKSTTLAKGPSLPPPYE